MADRWYIRARGRLIGPIDSKTLKQMAASGEVRPDDQVSLDQAKWSVASRVRGLRFACGDPTPPEPQAREARGFRYDAFISYRHVEPDRRWAKWLHSALETYRVPKKLTRELGIPGRIKRIFRDEEELPASADLSREIETALQQSRFLIVICSPRTPESKWVDKEVVRFREMGRNDRILALLIEAEPGEAFPRALCEIRHTVVRNGRGEETIEEVEPLAADVRANRPEPLRRLRRMAKLRFLACLLGCRFDDLRQREQERRARRLRIFGALAASLAIVLGGLTAVAVRQFTLRGEETRRADIEELRADREAYQKTLITANHEWVSNNDMEEARKALDRCRDDESLSKLRNWEWYFLHRRMQPKSSFGRDLALRGEVRAVVFRTEQGRLQCLAALADGALFHVWDLFSGRKLQTLIGHDTNPKRTRGNVGRDIRPYTFSRDAKRFMAVSSDARVRIWELETGRIVREEDDIRNLAWDAAFVVMALRTDDGIVLTHGGAADSPRGLLLRGEPGAFALNPSGNLLAIAGTDQVVRLWDTRKRLWGTRKGDPIATLKPYQGKQSGKLFFSDDGRQLAVPFEDRLTGTPAIAVWNLVALDRAPVVIACPDTRAVFSPDGRILVGRTQAGLVAWHCDSGFEAWTRSDLSTVTQFTSGSLSLFASFNANLSEPSGAKRGDSLLHLVGAADGKEISSFRGVGMGSLYPSPDGRQIVALNGSRSRRDDPLGSIWNFGAGGQDFEVLPDSFLSRGLGILSIAFSPDGRELRAVEENQIQRWDLDSGKPLDPVPLGEDAWLGYFSPDCTRVATIASRDSVITLWDAATGDRLRTLQGSEVSVGSSPTAPVQYGNPRMQGSGFYSSTSIAFTPDGSRVASFRQLDALMIWDTDTGKKLHTIALKADTEHFGGLSGQGGVRFSPDGRLIAVTNNDVDGGPSIWDARTGELFSRLSGVNGDLAFDPEGRLIMSANGAICDVNTGRWITRLETDSVGSYYEAAAFSADGRRIFTLAGGGLTIWEWDPETRLALSLITLPGVDGQRILISPDGGRRILCIGVGVSIFDAGAEFDPESFTSR